MRDLNFPRHSRLLTLVLLIFSFAFWLRSAEPTPDALKFGRFHPAFDHLGNVGEQMDAAIASGCTVVYATGVGAYSYTGLPPRATMDAYLQKLRAYNAKAHSNGVLVLSYLCATSIVDPDKFAANWGDYFTNRTEGFAPRRMLQQDIYGTNLPSWYGGAYAPADMWNPYWREYTKLTIRLAIESGHDGVFFDNPTVHPKGNYSEYAMKAWAKFLEAQNAKPTTDDLATLRALTTSQPELWRRFRTTEAADFFREMRGYARSLKPGFLLTANNSLNSWDSFYSQPWEYGYSIPEQSGREDFVTIEDMSSQPRRNGDSYVSYAGTLRLLRAINNGRPLSICTIDGNYIAPPRFMQLAIAECAAHDSAYMVWSCWDAQFRGALAESVAGYHNFMRTNENLFVDAQPASDLLLVWPYDNWLKRRDCPTAALARELSAANFQYDAVAESDVTVGQLKAHRAVIYSADEQFARTATAALLGAYERGGGRVIPVTLKATGDNTNRPSVTNSAPVHLAFLKQALAPALVTIGGSPAVRAVTCRTRDGDNLLHLYNLGVTRTDTYHDEATVAKNVNVIWYLADGQRDVKSIKLFSPDQEATEGEVKFTQTVADGRLKLEFVVPNLWVWTVVRPEFGRK